MGVLEIGIYGVLGVLALIGLLNGFLKEVVGILALGAALVAAYFAEPLIRDVAISMGIDVSLSQFLQTSLFAPGGSLDLSSIFQSIFSVISQGLAGLNLPAETVQPIFDIVNAEAAQLGVLISDALTGWIISTVSYLLVFLVVLLITNLILGALVKAVKKIKILGLFDRLLGVALGLIKGLLVVEIVLMVMIALGTILNIAQVQDYLDSELALTGQGWSLLKTLYDFTRDQFIQLGLISPQ